jgi:ribulose-phosphate 3-epimerase
MNRRRDSCSTRLWPHLLPCRETVRHGGREPHLIKIAPSILSADFTRLGEQVLAAEAAGVDRVQIDVMDGRFVPNITFGTLPIKALRPLTRLMLEAHLMVESPEDFIERFARAGADTIIVHQEATPHLHRSIEQIHSLGKKAGVAINPATPATAISEVLASVQLVLVMTVNPGFGGQEFIPETLRKIRQVRNAIQQQGLECEVEVDGGINEETAPLVVEAGADVLVAGSAVFGSKDGVAGAIQRLLASASREPR